MGKGRKEKSREEGGMCSDTTKGTAKGVEKSERARSSMHG